MRLGSSLRNVGNVTAALVMGTSSIQAGDYTFAEFMNRYKGYGTVLDGYRVMLDNGDMVRAHPFVVPEVYEDMNNLWIVVEPDGDIRINGNRDIATAGQFMYYIERGLPAVMRERAERYKNFSSLQAGEAVVSVATFLTELVSNFLPGKMQVGKVNIVQQAENYTRKAALYAAKRGVQTAIEKLKAGDVETYTDNQGFREAMYRHVDEAARVLDSIATECEVFGDIDLVSTQDVEYLVDRMIDVESDGFGAMNSLYAHRGDPYRMLSDQFTVPVLKGLTGIDQSDPLATFRGVEHIFVVYRELMRSMREEEFGLKPFSLIESQAVVEGTFSDLNK